MPLMSALERQRQLEASLVYRGSSRTVRVKQGDPTSKKTKFRNYEQKIMDLKAGGTGKLDYGIGFIS